MNKTYLSYGSSGSYYVSNQTLQDDNAIGVNKEVMVKRSVSKTGNHYKKGTEKWDLTSRYDQDSTMTPAIAAELEGLDEEEISEELTDKSAKERFEIIKGKKEERSKLEAQLLELNQKRNRYIADNISVEDKGELENAMLNALRSQAKAKSIQLLD